MDADVLIVGAGPTGLMLANQLARRGVRPLIIDRHSGPAQQSRAIVVQARTMEIYSQLGLMERALGIGREVAGLNMWANGRKRARIPFGDIGRGLSPFPYLLILGQDDNERIMGAKLNELGVEVQWNTELTALEQQPGHVEATVRQPDGATRSLRVAWVAGCDGSRSPVRELSGIGFPGAPYQHVFYVADTEVTGDMVPGELNVFLWNDGFHLVFPMHGKDRWRLIGILPPALRERDDLTFDELAPSIQRETGANLSFRKCDWISTYRIHHRAAEKFRDRRCFLLGDAAHIHSPAGAQGMNTGLQDAYNLGWKLALVVQGRADAALLESYEAERLPVARRLLVTTDRAFMLLVSQGVFGTLLRTMLVTRIAAFAMTIGRVRKLAFGTVSQIGIRYPESPLSVTLTGVPPGAPQAGDRFPWLKLRLQPGDPVEDLFQRLDDARFHLLVCGQPAPPGTPAADGLVETHVVPAHPDNDAELARHGIRGAAFYLLRPDGHVGLAGARLGPDAVRGYLSKWRIGSTVIHLQEPA
jgi:2-polyprenyl-6-methoxyphenol hydroxylase-like FAD-dependent oxidoreductase